MDAPIKDTIQASDKEAEYDDKVKKILGHKIILAHILVNTVGEFRGMNPKDVVNYIEGEPYISVTPVNPGITNKPKEKNKSETINKKRISKQIIGLNTENSEINEGMIRFDIIFYVRMKDGLTQMIINIEAQKEEPTKYYILNRGIFYVSRIISSQKERDFVNSEYNDMKKVYSIWICMNMRENTLTHIHLVEDDIIGSYNWKGDLELFNIIMIGLAEILPEKEEKYELHRLLSAILSSDLEVDEKLKIMEEEYRIPLENDIREEVEEMCNLSQGIKEKAFEEGQKRGQKKGQEQKLIEIVNKMYESKLSIEQIANIAEISVDRVKEIIR